MQTKKKSWLMKLLFLAVCGCTLLLSGCKPDPNEIFIEDTWYYISEHLNQIASEEQLEIFWTFAERNYSMYACCFNGQTQHRGQYRILASEGDNLTLELYNIYGDVNGIAISKNITRELRIAINPATDNITFDRSEFTRYRP